MEIGNWKLDLDLIICVIFLKSLPASGGCVIRDFWVFQKSHLKLEFPFYAG